MLWLGTFSIAARCPRTGMFGVAVSTAVPGAGPLVTFARSGVGAVATQSFVNVYLGIDGLKLLEQGLSAKETLDRLIEGDEGRDVRQVGVVDLDGRSAAWSGPSCVSWFGHRTGVNYSAQGNMLAGEETVQDMADAFERLDALDLPERLLVALEAAQAAGGDKRGRQSAALYVVDRDEYPLVDLRVDEHPYPVAELRRIFEIARHQLFPFREQLPDRTNQLGSVGEDVVQMLLTPPPQRPGGGGSAPD
jgi:uncharacterized Ntn-hydrolase superfamily protein